jgi:hypothetical protein
MLVDGRLGAYAFSYGGFVGDMHSASGNVALETYGQAVTGLLQAPLGDVWVYTAGELSGGHVAAGGSVGIVAPQDVRNSVTAGGDVWIASEQEVDAAGTSGVMAGGDLDLYALGNVAGNFHAGRDVEELFTYGQFNGVLSAGRDVEWVWVGGNGDPTTVNLSGSITAGRNIAENDWWSPWEYQSANIFRCGTRSYFYFNYAGDNLGNPPRRACWLRRGDRLRPATARNSRPSPGTLVRRSSAPLACHRRPFLWTFSSIGPPPCPKSVSEPSPLPDPQPSVRTGLYWLWR